MSGNFAIKGGGGRTPNGKCHLKFPFWLLAHLPLTMLLQWSDLGPIKKWSTWPEIEMKKRKLKTALMMMVEEDVYRSLMSIGLLGLQSFDNWRLPALGETFEVWTSFKDGNGERYLYFDGDCCWRCCKAKCSTVKMFNCSLTMVSLIGWRGLQERISV